MTVIAIILILIGILVTTLSGIHKHKHRKTKHTTGVNYLLLFGILLLIVGISLLIAGLTNHKNEPDSYRDYLHHVYPAMDMTRSVKEYKELYHSLGWYYQCCSSNQSYVTSTGSGTWNVVGPVATGPQGENADALRYIPNVASNDWNWNFANKPLLWEPMRCCTSTYKLPAIPLGNLYDWYSLQYFNVPVISNTKDGWNFAGSTSNMRDSKRHVNTVVSQSPNTSFSGFRLTNIQIQGIGHYSPRPPRPQEQHTGGTLGRTWALLRWGEGYHEGHVLPQWPPILTGKVRMDNVTGPTGN